MLLGTLQPRAALRSVVGVLISLRGGEDGSGVSLARVDKDGTSLAVGDPGTGIITAAVPPEPFCKR